MTMRTHLEDDVLMDVVEGTASADAARHAGDCPQCAARIADARAGMALAVGAAAPDPSPLFWDTFRRRVASDIEAEPRLRSRRFGGFLAPALLATAATVGVLSFLPRDPAPRAVPPAPVVVASAVPQAAESDAETLAASIDDLGCQDVDACVASLSEEESLALVEALRADLESGDL